MLSACTASTVRTFEADQNGVKLRYIYKHEANKVTELTVENSLSYSVLNVTTKEEAKQIIAPLAKAFQNIDGIHQSIEYRDTEAIERLKIDLTVANYDDIKHLLGITSNTAKDIGMRESATLLKEKGFTEIK